MWQWYYGRNTPHSRTLVPQVYEEMGEELVWVSDTYADVGSVLSHHLGLLADVYRTCRTGSICLMRRTGKMRKVA